MKQYSKLRAVYFSALGALACGLLLAATGCGGGEVPDDLIPAAIPPAQRGAPPQTSARNVLLITVDTLRADRVGCYGHAAAETPAMDRLAAGGVLFENFFAQSPVTLPSHTSILTGILPCTHGVRYNTVYEAGEDLRTLAEILKDNGYTTAAVIGAHVLHSRYGLGQGFEDFDDDFSGARRLGERLAIERTAEDVARRGLNWLDERGDEPFFLWLHFFDPHQAYIPPEPFASRFAHDPYDGEVAYTDFWIGKVLERLDAPAAGGPLSDRTMVILTSDHGEGLDDHGEESHGIFIYQTTIRIPMIVRCPGFEPAKVGEMAQTIDILPTVLELLGIDPEPQVTGRSLIPAMRGSPRRRLCYMETEAPLRYGCAPLKGLTNGRWKFIEAPRPELYDLVEDPAESRNLHEKRSDIAGRLREELDRLIDAHAPEEGLSRKRDHVWRDREVLKALGYAGGSIEKAERPGLPDPKDMIGVVTAVNNAIAMADAGYKGKALRRLDEVRREAPAYFNTYTAIGSISLEVGKNAEAARAFEKALEIDPDSTDALNGAAAARSRLGDHARALELAGRSVELDARNPMTFDALANIHLNAGNLDRALAEIRRGLKLEPYIVELRTTLGRIHLARGEHDAAAAELRKAVELDGKSWLTHFNLGLALGEMGRHDEALEALENARALNQRGPRVARTLGEAYFRGAEAALERHPPDPAEARKKAARARELGFEVPTEFLRTLKALDE